MKQLDDGKFCVPVLIQSSGNQLIREAAGTSYEHQVAKNRAVLNDFPGVDEIDDEFRPVTAANASDEWSNLTETERILESDDFLLSAELVVDDPEAVPEQVDGQPVFANPGIGLFSTCLNDPPVGEAQDVIDKLGLQQLFEAGMDGSGVALAIVDAGINRAHLSQKLGFTPVIDTQNSWRPPNSTSSPGEFRVGHGTMCAYSALIAAPKATLVDCAVFARGSGVGHAAQTRLSHALDGLQSLWRSWIDFSPDGLSRYNALVCCNSWGVYHPSEDLPAGHRGRFIDNPDHPFHHFIHMLSKSGIDMVFAAGNCGADCPDPACQSRVSETIMGANAHPDVLSVAGCDLNGIPVGYSSSGPGISGMQNQKPDVSCYTHYLGSEALGPGKPDAGTSTSAPLVGGFVASLRSIYPANSLPSSDLFDRIRRSSENLTNPGDWTADLGYGVVRPTDFSSGHFA